MSNKDKWPPFSLSNKKFKLKCLDKLLCMVESGKQYKYVIDIQSIKDRLLHILSLRMTIASVKLLRKLSWFKYIKLELPQTFCIL